MKILLVEDNQHLAQQLADALSVQRYAVDVANDGLEGWEYLQGADYDVVILDVMLPKLDGVSLCRRIREQGNRVPVLMLTALGTSREKVTGLDAGADDYLTKPVGVEELGARIRALLRRGHREASPVLTWGDLKLDPNLCEVSYGDIPLNLTPKEYSLLELFLRNQQRVYSRQAILDQLWSFSDDLPGEDTVKSHIKGLRHKLKAVGAKDLIETIYGLGYRLNALYLKAPGATPDRGQPAQSSQSTQQPASPAQPPVTPALPEPFAEPSVAAESVMALGALRSIAVLDRDPRWSETTFAQADRLGLRVQILTDGQSLETLGAGDQLPDAVILSLNLGDQRVLDRLDQLTTQYPSLPVLILTQGHTFEQRRALMHRHHAGFIDQADPLPEILAAIARVIDQDQAPEVKLLLVSDNLTLGHSVQSLLAPWNCRVALLHNLQQLWQTLDLLAPAMLLLDSQAFAGSGFEICQLLRQDRRWGWLPILMLGENTPHMMQTAFTAGADDYASQPIVGPELVTRILNRLERIQAIQTRSDRDALTGLSDRTGAIQELNRLIQLAKRSQQSLYLALLEIDRIVDVQPEAHEPLMEQALRQIGRLLLQSTRQGDLACRWDDSQFLLGAYGTTAREGMECLHRLLGNLRETPIEGADGRRVALSFSAGVVQYPTHGGVLQMLYQTAEAALKSAQAQGVGQVVMAELRE